MMRARRLQSTLFGLLLVLSSATQGLAQVDVQPLLQPLIEAHAGDVGLAVEILDEENQTLVSWEHAGTRVMPTASLIKLPIMIEAYRQADEGRLSLEDPLVLRAEDQVPGSGILTEHFSPGTRLALRDAIRLMIRYSDNTATNLVLDAIGLPSTNETMAGMGYAETQVHAKVYRRDTSLNPERSQQYGLGSTTAKDMVALLKRLETGELVSSAASQAMLEHLRTCDARDRLLHYLPADTQVAFKTGSVNRSRTVAGIIYARQHKIVLCVLTDNNQDVSWTPDNAANLLCARIAQRLVESLAPAAATDDDPQLHVGSAGKLVEALQRTLNARLELDLSVDGDFGPATEAAVKQFQTARGLAVTGRVDADTWKNLGEIQWSAAAVAPPEEINRQELPLAAPLDVDGPPAVTAKAYVVIDAATGDVLAGHNEQQALPNASTTKIMTAYLVLELAQQDPDVLSEVITFSERADNTLGSTAGVAAGEQLPVSELLYGLLLPSGNDASVALAEHFGDRLTDTVDDAQATAYDRFVAAMNAKASELGLANTRFANPHGLTAEGHHSSAADLAQLSRAAWALPHFAEYVSCRQHGCRVTSLSGYSRNLLWKNTNRLLGQAGFSGVKTGTTSAAGACLVARGERDQRPTLVVILGAASSDARYVDARNLFAWAWRASHGSHAE